MSLENNKETIQADDKEKDQNKDLKKIPKLSKQSSTLAAAQKRLDSLLEQTESKVSFRG